MNKIKICERSAKGNTAIWGSSAQNHKMIKIITKNAQGLLTNIFV